MKILELIPNLNSGGAERLVVDLSNELAKSHEVFIYTLYKPSDADVFIEELSPKIHHGNFRKGAGIDVGLLFRLSKKIRDLKPDIIHVHVRALVYLLPLLIFSSYRNSSVVYTVHNDAYMDMPSKWLRVCYKWFFRKRKVFPVVISQHGLESFLTAYNMHKYSVPLIYNGRQSSLLSSALETVHREIYSYKITAKTKVFLNIGRLAEQKNHRMLINAFEQAQNEGLDVVLIIIGGHMNTKSGKDIAQFVKCSCNERIRWLGVKRNVTDYLKYVDFFCLSSIYEGMPITLIEALEMGCIPICTPVGGIPEMIDSSYGFVAKSATIEDFLESIKKAYFCSDAELDIMSSKARVAYSERYNIVHCKKQYEALFNRILDNRT